MYVVEVMPLKRGVNIDTLSYFSSEPYSPGTLLKVPIRNTQTLAMVSGVSEVSAAKAALRAATFSLRKLPVQEAPDRLSPALVRTAERLSHLYAAPIGLVLYNLLPELIQNGEIPLPHTHHINATERHQPEVLEANRKERYVTYRSLVRETFAHGGSVLLAVPSSVEAEELFLELKTGIEDRVVVLTSTLSKKMLHEAYAALDDFSKPKLIIATPQHAVIERHDVTLTILEHARSGYYKEHARPYIDHRDTLRMHAEESGRRFVIGDLLVRTEDEHARREERYHTMGEAPKRIELRGKLEVVAMENNTGERGPFELLTPTVAEAIKETRKKKGRVFIFAARRGLAPVVACMDCGYIFRSPQSGAPYSLVRTMKDGVEERWFVCSTSGMRERAAETCPECGSWRLRERGIGIQFVHDELHKLFKGTPITLFDHTTAQTFKKAKFLADTFYNTKGGIMLGTSMAVPYLTRPIDTSIVVNMDALLATPTWRLEEENLGLLLALRESTSGTVYVQTRAKDIGLFNHAKHATLEHFYTEELALRKEYRYPPFTTFVHLTWQGTPEAVKSIETFVTELLKDFKPSVYPSPNPPRGTVIVYALMRLPSERWPQKALRTALMRLPPSVRVVINPDRIV